MNSTQITYVRKRIEEIYAIKSKEIKNNHIWIAPVLSVKEKLERIKKGEYKLKADLPYNKGSLDVHLIFNGQDNPNLAKEAAAYEKLRKERTRLIDELLLGDVKEALALLETFEKANF